MPSKSICLSFIWWEISTKKECQIKFGTHSFKFTNSKSEFVMTAVLHTATFCSHMMWSIETSSSIINKYLRTRNNVTVDCIWTSTVNPGTSASVSAYIEMIRPLCHVAHIHMTNPQCSKAALILHRNVENNIEKILFEIQKLNSIWIDADELQHDFHKMCVCLNVLWLLNEKGEWESIFICSCPYACSFLR